MKGTFIFVGFAATVAAVNGACPNLCSGHGRCGTNDVCTCYQNWQAGDCSERTCAFTKAWADVKDSSVTGREEHWYAECGNVGTCDRKTGLCECNEGFEGEGCERMKCPNECSGHGVCKTTGLVNSAYTGWDKDKIQQCVCDSGFSGSDCSTRMCKPGDDPISVSGSDEVQTVTIGSAGGNFAAGSQFTLTYTSWTGEKFVTRALDVDTLHATGIREALRSLPHRVIPDCTVALTTDTTTSKVFTVTFSDAATPGDQPMLTVDVTGCTSHGCQPYNKGVTGGTISSSVAQTTQGSTENTECSGRGICDGEVGVCNCFDGFYGEACQDQTLVA